MLMGRRIVVVAASRPEVARLTRRRRSRGGDPARRLPSEPPSAAVSGILHCQTLGIDAPSPRVSVHEGQARRPSCWARALPERLTRGLRPCEVEPRLPPSRPVVSVSSLSVHGRCRTRRVSPGVERSGVRSSDVSVKTERRALRGKTESEGRERRGGEHGRLGVLTPRRRRLLGLLKGEVERELSVSDRRQHVLKVRERGRRKRWRSRSFPPCRDFIDESLGLR